MISVIVPVKTISRYLRFEGFPAFQKQTYKKFEVIVVCDEMIGASPAPHRMVQGPAEPLQKKYRWLKIVGCSGSPSEKRNHGVSKAKGEILAFIDDDASAEQNSMKYIDEFFRKNTNNAVVCGPGILPKNASFSEQVFDVVLTSKFGSGSFTYRFQKEKARLVDDYPLMNFVIRKNIYKKIGGLVNHWPGEDSKLCEALIRGGYEIQYLPNLVVYHHRKKNLKEFLNQHSRYGFQRGLFFAEGDKNSRKIVYLLPSLFLLYLLLLPFELYFIDQMVFLFPFFLYYLFLVIYVGKLILKRKGLILSFFAGATMFLLHLTYAVFFIRGYIYELKKSRL